MANNQGTLRIGLAQLNSTVGDLAGNVERIVEAVGRASAAGCALVVFPEMAITGYPLEDLVLSQSVQAAATAAGADLASQLADADLGHVTVVVGTLGVAAGSPTNQALAISDGEIQAKYNKRHLPTYGVFDEGRVFAAGASPLLLTVESAAGSPASTVAVTICEDLWRASTDELQDLTAGADALLSLNASPFEIGKPEQRIELVRQVATTTGTPVVYVNSVGTQDELIFDGHSLATSPVGDVLVGPGFRDTVLVVDLDLETNAFTDHSSEFVPVQPAATRSTEAQAEDAIADTYLGIVQAVRDFVEKCGLSSVALGLSGGIDSALVAAIAVDALGPDKVFGLSMPSQHSSGHSKDDAADLATRTGLSLRTIPIAPLVAAYQAASQSGGVALTALAEENLQARVRGVLLMALSNSEGPMVLATGNKSELAVGYSTIYGDAVGGYAPLKDVYKTLVWDLARWRNAHAAQFDNPTPPIPESSIEKPPSAELRPDQLDTDSLPDYEVLDGILQLYIDQRVQFDDIVARGFDPELVREIIAKTNLAEYKRRQYPPGPKVTRIAFGRDRRLPISNRFI